jgi:hypothetical protein
MAAQFLDLVRHRVCHNHLESYLIEEMSK